MMKATNLMDLDEIPIFKSTTRATNGNMIAGRGSISRTADE
jgi:hypothetical protein